MKDFITPNETIRENDAASINAAIQAAKAARLSRIVIPRYNLRTKSSRWVIGSPIRVPSDFTVILDNCYMVQETGCLCNMFNNEHAYDEKLGILMEPQDRNIAVIGEGNVILDGGEHNNLRETTNGKRGLPNIWMNNMLCWMNVSGLRVENLHIRNQRWWAINHIFCDGVTLKNLNFFARPHVPNMDGIDLRVGCHDFRLENITGRTGDDLVAFTALWGRGEEARRQEGRDGDIHDVTLRNIKGDANTCYLFRILNHDGNQVYRIEGDTFMDSSDYTSKIRSGAAISVGSPFYYKLSQAAPGDTREIRLKNITSRGTHAVLLNHTVQDSSFDNIHTFGDNITGISTLDGADLQRVTVDGFYYGSDQGMMWGAGRAVKPSFGIRLPHTTGELCVKNMVVDTVKTAVEVGGGLRLELENCRLGKNNKDVVCDECSTVALI